MSEKDATSARLSESSYVCFGALAHCFMSDMHNLPEHLLAVQPDGILMQLVLMPGSLGVRITGLALRFSVIDGLVSRMSTDLETRRHTTMTDCSIVFTWASSLIRSF